MGKHQHLVDLALSGELPKLAIEFFIVFSRFECALKRSADYAAPGDNAKVNANWDAFAKDLGNGFFEEVKAQGLAPELLHSPPKLQVVLPNGGGLGWREPPAVNNSVELFLAIRRARNNLVHGAKYRDRATGRVDPVDGSERDERLLDQALAVLGLALERNAKVRGFFHPY
ncbi:hypothetical protein [Pseudomonas fontis]|uniref:RiboL-PSP-HEPN domain-containing protein n=1 Tax=Pseudomonas fontis TaxID=2942633 RepID=A0ABT5NTJ0_9PSED|nr:hypothetical protein [Pseudomonas fontis]MDD0976908.1 hypothetical protein [Pseudomonas fontis]MDD0991443.1 hypothetical protein [Pseudomonas fontis]